MFVIVLIKRCARAMGGLARTSYHPERHYMRGPGPACLRRSARAGG